MINATKSRRPSLFLFVLWAGLAVACGGGEPAREADPGAAAPAQEGVSGAPAEPLPELRTNDVGAVLVTQDEVLRMIDAGTAPLILDVRRPDEFAQGHVPGALNIPHTELAERLAEIDAARQRGLIVYCQSGRRAGIAEELLIGAGFSDVQHLEGDMRAWLEARRPVENPQ